MEFRFNLNEVFKKPIVEISHTLIPPEYKGDRRGMWDALSKVTDVINAMGTASAAAQNLTRSITTADRLRNSTQQQVYLLIDHEANNGKGAVTGMLKTGKKGLYVFDRDGQHFHVQAPCVLDFYVHESRQRSGYGKKLFEHMLQREDVQPEKLAIDRPSEKFLGFLNKHYSLSNPIRQMNNYVVYDGFFPQGGEKDEKSQMNNNGDTVTKRGTNGLQAQTVTSPYGRYGAPRPPCSMGQIIHNQSATMPVQEPTGIGEGVSDPQNEYYWPFIIPSEDYTNQIKCSHQTTKTIDEVFHPAFIKNEVTLPPKVPLDANGKPLYYMQNGGFKHNPQVIHRNDSKMQNAILRNTVKTRNSNSILDTASKRDDHFNHFARPGYYSYHGNAVVLPNEKRFENLVLNTSQMPSANGYSSNKQMENYHNAQNINYNNQNQQYLANNQHELINQNSNMNYQQSAHNFITSSSSVYSSDISNQHLSDSPSKIDQQQLINIPSNVNNQQLMNNTPSNVNNQQLLINTPSNVNNQQQLNQIPSKVNNQQQLNQIPSKVNNQQQLNQIPSHVNQQLNQVPSNVNNQQQLNQIPSNMNNQQSHMNTAIDQTNELVSNQMGDGLYNQGIPQNVQQVPCIQQQQNGNEFMYNNPQLIQNEFVNKQNGMTPDAINQQLTNQGIIQNGIHQNINQQAEFVKNVQMTDQELLKNPNQVQSNPAEPLRNDQGGYYQGINQNVIEQQQYNQDAINQQNIPEVVQNNQNEYHPEAMHYNYQKKMNQQMQNNLEHVQRVQNNQQHNQKINQQCYEQNIGMSNPIENQEQLNQLKQASQQSIVEQQQKYANQAEPMKVPVQQQQHVNDQQMNMKAQVHLQENMQRNHNYQQDLNNMHIQQQNQHLTQQEQQHHRIPNKIQGQNYPQHAKINPNYQQQPNEMQGQHYQQVQHQQPIQNQPLPQKQYQQIPQQQLQQQQPQSQQQQRQQKLQQHQPLQPQQHQAMQQQLHQPLQPQQHQPVQQQTQQPLQQLPSQQQLQQLQSQQQLQPLQSQQQLQQLQSQQQLQQLHSQQQLQQLHSQQQLQQQQPQQMQQQQHQPLPQQQYQQPLQQQYQEKQQANSNNQQVPNIDAQRQIINQSHPQHIQHQDSSQPEKIAVSNNPNYPPQTNNIIYEETHQQNIPMQAHENLNAPVTQNLNMIKNQQPKLMNYPKYFQDTNEDYPCANGLSNQFIHANLQKMANKPTQQTLENNSINIERQKHIYNQNNGFSGNSIVQGENIMEPLIPIPTDSPRQRGLMKQQRLYQSNQEIPSMNQKAQYYENDQSKQYGKMQQQNYPYNQKQQSQMNTQQTRLANQTDQAKVELNTPNMHSYGDFARDNNMPLVGKRSSNGLQLDSIPQNECFIKIAGPEEKLLPAESLQRPPVNYKPRFSNPNEFLNERERKLTSVNPLQRNMLRAKSNIQNSRNVERQNQIYGGEQSRKSSNVSDDCVKQQMASKIASNSGAQTPVKVLEESTPQPKLDRPQTLSLHTSSTDQNNPPPQIVNDDEVDNHSELDNVENDFMKVELSPRNNKPSPLADVVDEEHQARKTPSHLTDQGYFDLKFYHNKLW